MQENVRPKIGIIVAMEKEAQPFLDEMGSYREEVYLGTIFDIIENKPNMPDIVVAISGVGEIQAAMATCILIDHYKATRIINFGYAGYYDNNLKVGDIVNISRVYHCDMDLTLCGNQPGQYDEYELTYFPLDTSFFEDITELNCELSSSDRFLEDGEERNKLIKLFGKNAADMEGAGIAVVCFKSSVPCSIIKCISNTVVNNYDDYYEFSQRGIIECAKKVADRLKNLYQ